MYMFVNYIMVIGRLWQGANYSHGVWNNFAPEMDILENHLFNDCHRSLINMLFYVCVSVYIYNENIHLYIIYIHIIYIYDAVSLSIQHSVQVTFP